jgi:hypothetical protein
MNMARLPTDNPNEIQTRPSGPEFIDLNEINGLYELEFTMPPAGSPTCILAQPGTAKSSQKIGASNPLIKLIKIYDDDESP